MTTTSEANQTAREELDFWEHYSDHAGFIAEVGGQEAYDVEYSRRCAVFFALNCKSVARS